MIGRSLLPNRTFSAARSWTPKIVSPIQERAILGYLATTRSPARDQVMLLLSMKAGLRAKEMASLTWAMVTDAQGQVAMAIIRDDMD